MSDLLFVGVGTVWATLAITPIARRARRDAVTRRARALRPPGPPTRRPGIPAVMRTIGQKLGPVTRVVGALARRQVARRSSAALERELPVTIDLLAVGIGAGCTPFLAVDVAALWAPPELRSILEHVRRSCALGASFADALNQQVSSTPVLRALVDALLASERYGAPVGDALARLADEERASLRRRAEARARTVPVRLLFPLVFLVLPAFGLLTVAPALLTGFSGH